jgi:hypothetical protein
MKAIIRRLMTMKKGSEQRMKYFLGTLEGFIQERQKRIDSIDTAIVDFAMIGLDDEDERMNDVAVAQLTDLAKAGSQKAIEALQCACKRMTRNRRQGLLHAKIRRALSRLEKHSV